MPFEELQEVFAGARKGVEAAPTDEFAASAPPNAAPAPASAPPTNPKLNAARIKNMSPEHRLPVPRPVKVDFLTIFSNPLFEIYCDIFNPFRGIYREERAINYRGSRTPTR